MIHSSLINRLFALTVNWSGQYWCTAGSARQYPAGSGDDCESTQRKLLRPSKAGAVVILFLSSLTCQLFLCLHFRSALSERMENQEPIFPTSKCSEFKIALSKCLIPASCGGRGCHSEVNELWLQSSRIWSEIVYSLSGMKWGTF